MNSRTFIGMAAAAVTFIVLAVLLTQSRDRSTSAAASDERLFPALAETINEISSVVVEHPDGTLTLERDGTDWGLAEKGGYPVDGAKVRALLLGLVDATKVEVKTASADRYEMLGVQDLDREGADGTRVTLEGGAGTPLASLIVGHERTSGAPRGRGAPTANEYYVRPSGEEQSWLVSGQVSADADPLAWLVKDVLDVDRNRIQAVQVEHADGELIYVRRPDDTATDYDVVNMPEGKVVTFASAPGSLASGLSRLTLEDVLTEDAVEFPSPADSVCTFWTFDGLKVVAAIHEEGDKLYARFEASYDESGPPDASQGPEPPEAETEAPDDDAGHDHDGDDHGHEHDGDADGEEGADEEAGPTPEEIREEAGQIQGRVGGWTYVLPSWKKGAFTKRMEELVKDPDPPAAEEPAADAEGAFGLEQLEEVLTDETVGSEDEPAADSEDEAPDDGR